MVRSKGTQTGITDRAGQGGGTVVRHKIGLHAQLFNIDLPDALEIMFLKLFVGSEDTILLPSCCRPQWQGSAPLEYLRDNLDTLVMQHARANMLIVGGLNHHLVPRSFDELLLIHDLCNHVLVGFPTHESGESLDFVLSDFPSPLSRCESLSYISS